MPLGGPHHRPHQPLRARIERQLHFLDLCHWRVGDAHPLPDHSAKPQGPNLWWEDFQAEYQVWHVCNLGCIR